MIQRILRDRSRDRSHSFVFPSQVAADFWCRWVLEARVVGAIENDRFVSWDAFKERYLTRQSELRPINNHARRLYAASLLAEDAGALDAVLPASSSAASFLARILPELPRLRTAEAASVLPPATWSTWNDLARRYERFLAEQGLFEPSWQAPEAQPLGGGVTLFFPELLEDFSEYEEILAGESGIELFGADALEEPGARRFYEFGHVHNEMRRAMLEVARLLSQGVAVRSIAVTVAGLENHRRQLISTAEAYGVPLRERSGLPVRELPGGRFFGLLDDWYRRAFHPDALALLVLDGSLPWREPSSCRELLARGREARCIAADRRSARRRWLRAVGSQEKLRSLFRRIAGLSESIIEARSFGSLRKGLYEFIGALFADENWQPEALAVFQRGTLLASKLVALEEELGLAVPSPWSQLLALLGEENYVPQYPAEGVALYPYRVSAGIGVEHHILLNLTHAETRVRKDPLAFLREDLRERLPVEPVDLTDAFLGAYSRSGGNIWISHARVNARGPQITPAFFMGSQGGEYVSPEEIEDPYQGEIDYYLGTRRIEEVGRLHRRQREGSAWMATRREARRQRDYTREKIEERSLLARLLDAEGELALSASRVDLYRSSPFAYLLQSLLQLEELDLDPHLESPLLVGSYYHELLRELNQVLIREAILLSKESGEEVRRRLEAVAADYGSSYVSRELKLPEPALLTLVEDAVARIWPALELELERLPPFTVTHAEFPFDLLLDEGVRVTGRIDRLGVTEEGAYTVVDYKKSSGKSIAEISPIKAGGAEEVGTLQLPIYLLALENTLRRPVGRTEEVYYLGLEKRELRFLRTEATKARETLDGAGLEEFCSATRTMLLEAARSIREGDFRCEKGAGECDGCPFRGVCRSKFVVRDRRG